MVTVDLSHLARSGSEIAIIATPKASSNRIVETPNGLRVYVTVVAEGGKANTAIVKLLSKALGVSKSRLVLLRGETSRNKIFRVLE